MNPTSASPATIEAQHPGMRAIAGPYGVNNTTPSVAIAERAACVRAYRDQVRNGVKAKVVMCGRFAWLLRSEKGWRYDDTDKMKNQQTIARVKNGGRD